MSRITEDDEKEYKLISEKGSFAQIVEEGLKQRNLNKDIRYDIGRDKRRSTSQEPEYFPVYKKELKRVYLKPKSQNKHGSKIGKISKEYLTI